MIKDQTVVSLSYSLKNSEGEELGRAEAAQPLSYLHGSGQIVPGLEQALEGLNVGDKKDITVSPKEGYGEVVPNLKMKVERKLFPPDADIQPGMQFRADIGNGKEHTFTVMSVEGDDINIDGNHPLSGQTLHFSVEVVEIREATKEELEHGHAHGPGGAHNH